MRVHTVNKGTGITFELVPESNEDLVLIGVFAASAAEPGRYVDVRLRHLADRGLEFSIGRVEPLTIGLGNVSITGSDPVGVARAVEQHVARTFADLTAPKAAATYAPAKRSHKKKPAAKPAKAKKAAR